MLVIELTFMTGRYHATQWGRNVNEGIPEWPPSPYRLARACIDVGRRRFSEWPENRVMAILETLSCPAFFSLPAATNFHTRSFLPANEKDVAKRQLVLDSFTIVEKNEPVFIGFECDPSEAVMEDIVSLLHELPYLGRSESWVNARLARDIPRDWNCLPLDRAEAEVNSQSVACLVSPAQYGESYPGMEAKNWLEAISMSSNDLLKDGWSDPPALEWRHYSVPAFVVPKSKSVRYVPRFRYAKYALSGSVLPVVTDTIAFAEKVRRKLMGIHKNIKGGDPTLVSPIFSGKDAKGNPLEGHGHAFFLPTDENRDGRIDHIIIISSEPFDRSELQALDRLRSIWQEKGRPAVELVLVSLDVEAPGTKGMHWESLTPFVTTRHYRKGRGTFQEWLCNEVRRECSYHGLPSPSQVRWIERRSLEGNRHLRWPDYKRTRKGRIPLPGYGCILSFDRPVEGPFALGSLCHFGLGMFDVAASANLKETS